jgi:hypothetical protein
MQHAGNISLLAYGSLCAPVSTGLKRLGLCLHSPMGDSSCVHGHGQGNRRPMHDWSHEEEKRRQFYYNLDPRASSYNIMLRDSLHS